MPWYQVEAKRVSVIRYRVKARSASEARRLIDNNPEEPEYPNGEAIDFDDSEEAAFEIIGVERDDNQEAE